MWDGASPADIVAFLQRIDATVLPNRTPHEAWVEFLKKNNGGVGSLNEMERNWLNAKGGAGANTGKGNGDQVAAYTTSKGFSGSRGDVMRAYLRGSATQ